MHDEHLHQIMSIVCFWTCKMSACQISRKNKTFSKASRSAKSIVDIISNSYMQLKRLSFLFSNQIIDICMNVKASNERVCRAAAAGLPFTFPALRIVSSLVPFLRRVGEEPPRGRSTRGCYYMLYTQFFEVCYNNLDKKKKRGRYLYTSLQKNTDNIHSVGVCVFAKA